MLGRITEKIGRYSGQVAAGMGFVKSAEVMMDDAFALDSKYRIQGQSAGLGTIKEGATKVPLVMTDPRWLGSTQGGKHFVAGMNSRRSPNMKDMGIFKLFTPGGNQ